MHSRSLFIASGWFLITGCSGNPYVIGVADSGGTSNSTAGRSSGFTTLGGTGNPQGGSLGVGGTKSGTGGAPTTNSNGDNCSCLRGAYVPVCGTNGITFDATCGDSCVPVPIECRHSCPCSASGGASNTGGTRALTSGGASSIGAGGTSAAAGGRLPTGGTTATGGTSTGASSSTSTDTGLCGSGCSANTTIQSLCSSPQVTLLCTGPLKSNLSSIMSANGCTDAGIDAAAFCCPPEIMTQCQ